MSKHEDIDETKDVPCNFRFEVDDFIFENYNAIDSDTKKIRRSRCKLKACLDKDTYLNPPLCDGVDCILQRLLWK